MIVCLIQTMKKNVQKEANSNVKKVISSPKHTISLMVGGGLVAKLCPSAVTPWTAARQVPLPVGFCRQEY